MSPASEAVAKDTNYSVQNPIHIVTEKSNKTAARFLP